ncbi:hypothetical protein NJ7G_2666 [Natrinema sp. J7-2]|nr:hypothetical protein NJ7G_2666 [Natrinema sp. J7-2]
MGGRRVIENRYGQTNHSLSSRRDDFAVVERGDGGVSETDISSSYIKAPSRHATENE